MIKRICDRCNQEIKGNYWVIDICEETDSTIAVSSINVAQNVKMLTFPKKEYCPECISEIKEYIGNKEKNNNHSKL